MPKSCRVYRDLYNNHCKDGNKDGNDDISWEDRKKIAYDCENENLRSRIMLGINIAAIIVNIRYFGRMLMKWFA